MKRTLWKYVDLSWFIAFEILLSFAFKIPLIGLFFIPVILLFMKLFSITVVKFGSSWIIWSIPYAFSSIFYLSFFSRMNPVVFTFKTFWLSLSTWYSHPVSPFGLAAIFFAISYIAAYITVHLIKRTLNTFLVLSVLAAISGMVTQYCCREISFGFMILFITSFALSLNIHKRRLSRMFVILLTITVVVGSSLFLIDSFSTPLTPLKSIIPHSTTSSTLTNVKNAPISHGTNAYVLHSTNRIAGIPIHRKLYVPHTHFENVIFNIVIYVIGGAIIGVGVFFFIAFFKFKRRKKKNIKWSKLMLAIWIVASAFFIIGILTYALNLAGNSMKVPKTAFQFNPNKVFLPTNLPRNIGNISSYIGGVHGKVEIGEPIIWLILAAAGLAVMVFMIFKFLKDVTPFSAGAKTSNPKEEENVQEQEELEKDFANSTPWKIVLFYYKLLRKKVGNPSSTPYEFEKYLREKVEDEGLNRATDLFVRLRYAHQDITHEDAEFMKNWVKSVIKKLA